MKKKNADLQEGKGLGVVKKRKQIKRERKKSVDPPCRNNKRERPLGIRTRSSSLRGKRNEKSGSGTGEVYLGSPE